MFLSVSLQYGCQNAVLFIDYAEVFSGRCAIIRTSYHDIQVLYITDYFIDAIHTNFLIGVDTYPRYHLASINLWSQVHLFTQCYASDLFVSFGIYEGSSLLANRLSRWMRHLNLRFLVTLELPSSFVESQVVIIINCLPVCWSGALVRCGSVLWLRGRVVSMCIFCSMQEQLEEELCAALSTFAGPDPRNNPDYARIINKRHLKWAVGVVGWRLCVCVCVHIEYKTMYAVWMNEGFCIYVLQVNPPEEW